MMVGFRGIMKKRDFGKEGIISEYLPWILIAIAILVILLTTIFLLKGNGITLIDKIKNLFHFK